MSHSLRPQGLQPARFLLSMGTLQARILEWVYFKLCKQKLQLRELHCLGVPMTLGAVPPESGDSLSEGFGLRSHETEVGVLAASTADRAQGLIGMCGGRAVTATFWRPELSERPVEGRADSLRPFAMSWEGRGVDDAFLSPSTPSAQAPEAGSRRTDVRRGQSARGGGAARGTFPA